MKKFILLLLFQFIVSVYMRKKGAPINMTQNSPKRENPAFSRDRQRNAIFKPEMPDSWTQRHKKPFQSGWMDYCDPYHCNDYHSIACGLNRRKMKFKWFQSICHLILNNQCSNYRGSLKFDLIARKYCHAYVMFLRMGCPTQCNDDIEPICAMSSIDGHVAIFKNQCSMEMVNCRNTTLQEYDEVYMSFCEYKLLRAVDEINVDE